MQNRVLFLCTLGLAAACGSPNPMGGGPDEGRAALFEGTGTYSLQVTTDDPLAQRYFDQGLALCHGYNHDEAARSFAEARRIDPDCAMAYWGEAYALGPNYNLWDEGEDYAKRAFAAMEQARAFADGETALERDLIAALSTRFAQPKPETRTELNAAYSAAMRDLWQRYPGHAEVGFLYADALLNEHPWDQWNVDGTPKHDTPLIMAVLERVMELNVNHPGANHLYIHTMEASHTPEKAEAAADRLGKLAPGLGHVVHMPSHIYMRVGRYEDSTRVNRIAARLDREYFARTGTEETTGIYHGYHLHNHHFLIWSAMFEGRYEDALEQCDLMIADMPKALYDDPFYTDFFNTKLHVYLRFGKWKEALQSPRPPTEQPLAIAMWHYAHGVAAANLGDIKQARAEVREFEREAAKVPADQYIHVVPARDVIEVARRMLNGETAYKAGDIKTAFTELRAAVAAETGLRYTEPNPWMMPTRHALGALLLEQGRVAEAETCYREDLARYPNNGWSLHGLAECLAKKGATTEASATKTAFDAAWAKATVALKGSCFCRTR